MELKLIDGEYTPREALALITSLVHVKIKAIENQINTFADESDIKSKESKIKQLQAELHEIRDEIMRSNSPVVLSGLIRIKR
jgi:cell division protein FtsL